MSIEARFHEIRDRIPDGVSLVAVTKTRTPDEIMELLRCGHRRLGESKVQELLSKYEALPSDIEWHLIGHLQSNKVKHIAPFISLIHSVDSLKLLKAINKEGKKNNRIIPCLLQLHIAQEESKYGFSPEEVRQVLEDPTYLAMEYVAVKGLMGMATFTTDHARIRKEFSELRHFFETLKSDVFAGDPAFCELSMGMSDDFEIGIAEGSTMVRVGSAIFGDRQ